MFLQAGLSLKISSVTDQDELIVPGLGINLSTADCKRTAFGCCFVLSLNSIPIRLPGLSYHIAGLIDQGRDSANKLSSCCGHRLPDSIPWPLSALLIGIVWHHVKPYCPIKSIVESLDRKKETNAETSLLHDTVFIKSMMFVVLRFEADIKNGRTRVYCYHPGRSNREQYAFGDLAASCSNERCHQSATSSYT